MIHYVSNSPLPALRADISAYEMMPGLMVLYDDISYTDKMARVPEDYLELLSLMNGKRTAEELVAMAASAGRALDAEAFLNMVNVLENAWFLDSPRFRLHREQHDRDFNEAAVRPAAHAGASYPDDPAELREMLDGFLQAGAAAVTRREAPVAVIAPHIDFRVGGASYGPAYTALKHSTADTFVIFGVSHQMSYDAFMISSKDFQTPLGTVETDREFIEHYRSRVGFDLTRNEIAHRREHSIEFQVVFLKHIFPDRPFRIVPILTGSLHEYVEGGRGDAAEDIRLSSLYRELQATAGELGREVCYIAGADLCHVGRKFGDDFPASEILPALRTIDAATLAEAARPDAEGFLRSISSIRNQYRVCGVAPIYATIRTARPATGEVLCYGQWDEAERESAVTFASVAYYR